MLRYCKIFLSTLNPLDCIYLTRAMLQTVFENKRILQGTAYTFFTYANGPKARDLIKVLQEANQIVPPELCQLAKTAGGGSGGRPRYVFLFLFKDVVPVLINFNALKGDS